VGGPIGMRLATQHPEWIAGLIHVDDLHGAVITPYRDLPLVDGRYITADVDSDQIHRLTKVVSTSQV